MQSTDRSRIRELMIFQALDDARLDKLASRCVLRQHTRGELIWRQGEEARCYAFVVSGHVKICRLHEDGREMILGVFGEGEPIGHVAVYRGMPFPASAVALSEACIMEIERCHLLDMMRDDVVLMEVLLFGMMEHARYLSDRLHELTLSSATQRLALLFCTFAQSLGVRKLQADGEVHLHLALLLSRQDIASLINTRVETAIRMMSRWHREGLLLTTQEGFIITDPLTLSSIARGEQPDVA